jgi:signal transduction histidine kinase
VNHRLLWSTIAVVAAVQVVLVLIVSVVLSGPRSVSESRSSPRLSATSGPMPPSMAVQRLADMVSSAASRPAATSIDGVLDELIKQASTWPEVLYVSVEDTDGKVIAHTDPTRIGQVWSAPHAPESYQEALAPILGPEVSGKPGPVVGRVHLGFRAEPSPAVAAAVPRPVERVRLLALLVCAAVLAVPVGLGLVLLANRLGGMGEAVPMDLLNIQTVSQARGTIVHWMRETDLVRAQFAGQREELQKLRAEVAQGAHHLAQAAAESEQLLTERAHWIEERVALTAEVSERDQEIDRLRASSDERASEADEGRLLLEAEIADLRDELRQAHGALAGHPAVCRELLEQELRQHQHRAVAYISHAIRGSLTNILGFSKLLLRDGDGSLSESQRANAQHVHEAGAHLLRVVNDLSDLTQLEMGTVELRDEVVDVPAVVRELRAAGSAAPAIDPEAVTVSVPPDLPPVRGSTRRLTQLLLTLMQPPTRHDGGPVEISASADDASVVFAVTHPESSLPLQDIASLFDPFAPVDATSTPQDDGRRLRLALARALAHAIGGSIEVDGEAGRGTRFTVRIPVAPDMSAVA